MWKLKSWRPVHKNSFPVFEQQWFHKHKSWLLSNFFFRKGLEKALPICTYPIAIPDSCWWIWSMLFLPHCKSQVGWPVRNILYLHKAKNRQHNSHFYPTRPCLLRISMRKAFPLHGKNKATMSHTASMFIWCWLDLLPLESMGENRQWCTKQDLRGGEQRNPVQGRILLLGQRQATLSPSC